MGGGTGSGLGSAVMTHMIDENPDRVMSTYPVFPSPDKFNTQVIAPYNELLCMQQLIENSYYSVLLDNHKLWHIAHQQLGIAKPSYADLNWLISMSLSGCTAPLRFRGNYNDNLRKMSLHLTPFPRMHFFTVSHAPLARTAKQGQALKLTTQDLTDALWSKDNVLADIDPKNGKYVSSICSYRQGLVDAEILTWFVRQSGLKRTVSRDVLNLFVRFFAVGNEPGKKIIQKVGKT